MNNVLKKSIRFCNEQLRRNNCDYSFVSLTKKETDKLNRTYSTGCYAPSTFNIAITSTYGVVLGTISLDIDEDGKALIDSTCVFNLFRRMKLSVLLRAAAFIFIYYLIEDDFYVNYIESLAANPVSKHTLEKWFGFECSDDILPVCSYDLDNDLGIDSPTTLLYIRSLYVLDSIC